MEKMIKVGDKVWTFDPWDYKVLIRDIETIHNNIVFFKYDSIEFFPESSNYSDVYFTKEEATKGLIKHIENEIKKYRINIKYFKNYIKELKEGDFKNG
jgi:hypothetical protein